MEKVEGWIRVVAGILGGIVSILVGSFGLFFTILLGMMLVDFITGIMAAVVSGEGLKSSKGYKGLFKKLYTMLLIGAVFMLEISVLKTNGVITDSVSSTFIIIEFVSIVENGNRMGLKLGFLKNLIASAKEKVNLLGDNEKNK